MLVPVLPYDREALRTAIFAMRNPNGGTAIGDAMDAARQALYRAGTIRKYILVVTDGENTDGPVAARGRAARSPGAAKARCRMYFVAFDIDARKFDFVREVRGEVLGAGNGDRAARQSRHDLPRQDPRRGDGRRRVAPRRIADSPSAKETMIFGKFFNALRAQLNKIANFFFEADPIAVMQLEVDQATERLKEGRKGLEMYRGLVETVARQVATSKSNATQLESQIKAHLKAGNRDMAGQLARAAPEDADRARGEHRSSSRCTRRAYQNNLLKIQKANKDIVKVREKIRQYDAELKMSAAEAEIAQISESFEMNMTTDFGQIESVIQQQIDTNRGRARVAVDMSAKGVAEIKAEEAAEKAMAEDLLSEIRGAAGTQVAGDRAGGDTAKTLGPVTDKT